MTDNFQTAVIAARRLVLQFKRENNNSLPHPVPVEPISKSSGWGATSRPASILNSAETLWHGSISCVSYPPLDKNPLQACVMIYPARAEIYVSQHQNYCWKRFLVVKEICHILMGHSSNYTTVTPDDIEALISNVLNNVTFTASEALKVESLGYVAAIEVLFPKEHVEEAIRLSENGATTLQIANVFRIPVRIVEWRLKSFNTDFESVYRTKDYENLPFSAVKC